MGKGAQGVVHTVVFSEEECEKYVIKLSTNMKEIQRETKALLRTNMVAKNSAKVISYGRFLHFANEDVEPIEYGFFVMPNYGTNNLEEVYAKKL